MQPRTTYESRKRVLFPLVLLLQYCQEPELIKSKCKRILQKCQYVACLYTALRGRIKDIVMSFIQMSFMSNKGHTVKTLRTLTFFESVV